MAEVDIDKPQKYNSIISESIQLIKEENPSISEKEIILTIENEISKLLITSITNQNYIKSISEKEIQFLYLKYKLNEHRFPEQKKQKEKYKIEHYENIREFQLLKNYFRSVELNEKFSSSSVKYESKWNFTYNSNHFSSSDLTMNIERDTISLIENDFLTENSKNNPQKVEGNDFLKTKQDYNLDSFNANLDLNSEEIKNELEVPDKKINVDFIIAPLKNKIPKKFEKKEKISIKLLDFIEQSKLEDNIDDKTNIHEHDLIE